VRGELRQERYNRLCAHVQPVCRRSLREILCPSLYNRRYRVEPGYVQRGRLLEFLSLSTPAKPGEIGFKLGTEVSFLSLMIRLNLQIIVFLNYCHITSHQAESVSHLVNKFHCLKLKSLVLR